MSVKLFQFRRGTAAVWAAANPVLSAGEPGYETDSGVMKIGDGANPWSSLPTPPVATRGARVFRSAGASDQLIPNNAFTAVQFDSESFDSNSLHDQAVNNSRVKLNKVGKWLVTAVLSFRGNATGTRIAHLRLNGTAVTKGQDAGSIDENHIPVTDIVVATAVTDFIELFAFQNSGGNLGAQFGAAETFLAAHYIGT